MKKIILITGSTDGIGKLAAIKLAHDGHHIYIHGRNAEKLKAVISKIKSATGNVNIHGYQADFSDLNAVKNMANQMNKDLNHLDILINNAGVFNSKTASNKEGLDMRLTVNYLAPYLLTHTILPLLRKGKKPRIINLSSAAQATVDLEVLEGNRQITEQQSYAQSKLALTMWSFFMAKQESEIVIIPVNPGSLLNTKMVKEAFGRFWSSPEKGANILYELASNTKYQEQSGKYFDNDKGQEIGTFGPAHKDAYDEVKIDQLLDATKSIMNNYI